MATARPGANSSGRHRQMLAIDDMALLGFSVRTPQAIQRCINKASNCPDVLTRRTGIVVPAALLAVMTRGQGVGALRLPVSLLWSGQRTTRYVRSG